MTLTEVPPKYGHVNSLKDVCPRSMTTAYFMPNIILQSGSVEAFLEASSFHPKVTARLQTLDRPQSE